MAIHHGDSDLSCPGCGYSLTGIKENTCPECGREFDRAHLRGLNRKYSGVIEVPPYVIAIVLTVIGVVLLTFAIFSIPGGQVPADVWRGSLFFGVVAMFASVGFWRHRWKQ